MQSHQKKFKDRIERKKKLWTISPYSIMKCESSSTITFSCILVFYLTTTLTSVTPEVGVKKNWA